MAVIDSRFCYPFPLELILQEGMSLGMGYGGDSFTATDHHGHLYFRQAARFMSLSDKRVLADAGGRPLVGMAHQLIALKNTWLVYRGDSFDERTRVATVKANFSFSPSVSVYLNDGDKDSDFKIRGNFLAKNFTVSQKLPGGGERVVATVKKESKFASMDAFMVASFTGANKYFVHIETGVDAAFMVALAALVDEMFNDKQGK